MVLLLSELIRILETHKVIVLYKSNFILITFFTLSIGLGFDNLDYQTNKPCLHYTIHKNPYKVYHKDQSLVNEKSQEDIDLKF